jgi:DNA polymerase III subunit chi
MRADFYLLSRDPVEAALPRIARSVKSAGERLLVVSADPDQLAALDKALWEQFPEDFLAHGSAGEPHAERQPLLLAQDCTALNDARFVAFADGTWRDEAFGFERAFLFFDGRTIEAARGTWRMLGEREGVERHFWKQDGGRWVEGP